MRDVTVRTITLVRRHRVGVGVKILNPNADGCRNSTVIAIIQERHHNGIRPL
jgi:hypothetical protein